MVALVRPEELADRMKAAGEKVKTLQSSITVASGAVIGGPSPSRPPVGVSDGGTASNAAPPVSGLLPTTGGGGT